MRRAFFVTALLLEMRAVRAHLTDMGSVLGRNGTVYECGSFSDRGGEWLVVVAETGAGTHPAHNIASDAHVVFGSFEVQILVGIGGSRKEDAPIGSVVASDKIYWPYGGKVTAEGFLLRPTSFPLDARLIGLAKKVRRDGEWPTRIVAPRGGSLPAIESYPTQFPPEGLVAPIASIEAVLDYEKSELEQLLVRGYGDTHVVEMEGFGAVYAASAERTPSIVVRGVSDMRQKKSPGADKILQPVAAAHAAAFAFELLSHWGQLYAASAEHPGVSPILPASPDPEQVDAPVAGPNGPDHSSSSGEVEGRTRISVVLNLAVDWAPDDEARLDQLQSTLRQIAGDQQIEIVRVEAGSLRLFVADPNRALQRIGIDALREALGREHGAELAGMVDCEEFGHLATIKDQFARVSTELLKWPADLPDGERMDRPELQILRSRIDDHDASTTALIGDPGAGKSALLATLGILCAAEKLPVLAIKADLLDIDIASEADLQDRLGLDELPSLLVERLAAFGPVVLLIDQLDALAQHLDIRTGRLSVLLNLVRKLGGRRNVHIVLSSRTFEFQHDVRLRAVAADSVMLELPAWSEVLALLEARGIDAGGWPSDAQDVMRRPQALATYLRLSGRTHSEAFSSYQAMLERLWSERVLAGPRAGELEMLAADLADQMAERECLWLPTARFTDRLEALRTLEGAGIVSEVDGSIGFSHQTLFEFALARGFARTPGRLSDFVLTRQSSLFLRPKLWAGLTYLRAVDPNAYHGEIVTILNAGNLRAHLRALLVDFLGAQQDPTDREALLMETMLAAEKTRLRGFRAISGSRGWFERFARSFIADAMNGGEEVANLQIDLLGRAMGFASASVVKLLRDRWLPNPEHDGRLWWVIQPNFAWTSEILDIAIEVVKRSDIAPLMIDNAAAMLGVEQPDYALMLVRARLDRELASAVEEAEERLAKEKPDLNTPDDELLWRLETDPREPIKRLIDRGDEWDSLPALAEEWPLHFMEIMWPWYLTVFQMLARYERQREWRLYFPVAHAADFRFDDEHNIGLPEHALLGALRIAVERLAETDNEAFSQWVEENASEALGPVQRVIAHGIAHRPQACATLGLDFLMGDHRRYSLGSIHDAHGTTKTLIAAVAPFWDDEQTKRFEAHVRALDLPPPEEFTDPKGRMFWRHSVRRTQLEVLRALPTTRLSSAARREIAEGERRFGSRITGTVSSGVQWIGSIMEAGAMAKASDSDIINAFRELPDATGWDNPKHWMRGGNIQLARAFATFAKENDERALRIVAALDKSQGTRAAAYALDTLSEDAVPETVFALLDDVVSRGFDAIELRHSAARALERLSRRDIEIEEKYLTLLESWLQQAVPTDDDDDSVKEAIDSEAGRDDDDRDRSLLWGYGGMGIVPGGDFPIIEAIVHLRLTEEKPDIALAAVNRYLDTHKDFKEWDVLARYLPYLSAADVDAFDAFMGRLYESVPSVIGAAYVAQFLAGARVRSPDLVAKYLTPWRTATTRRARHAYGEIVALTAVMNPEIGWGVEYLEGIFADPDGIDARAGAALTGANLFVEPEHRAGASALLVRLLESGEAGVWDSTFDLFRLSDELHPDGATLALLHAIADRLEDAPQLDATFVVERLSTMLPHHAVLVGTLAQRLANKWRSELGDIRTATAMATAQLVDLAVTLHRLGAETREMGTELIEQLIDTNAYEAKQMLDEIDSRFRATVDARRPRLRRRARGTGRRRSPRSQ